MIQSRWQKISKDMIHCVMLFVVALLLCGNGYPEQEKKEVVVITHVVATGETLWTVAEQYITPDRYMPEFLQGIYEANYEVVFEKREKSGVQPMSLYPGDQLEIRYWRLGEQKHGVF